MRRLCAWGGVVAAALLVTAMVAAQEVDDRPVITVLDFEHTGLSEAETKLIVDAITSFVVDTGRYRVIDRRERAALLEEMDFSLSDCTDETCQLRVGRMLSAQRIIVGSIGRVGNRYMLTLKQVGVETGETVNSATEMYGDLDALLDDTQRLTYSFVGETILLRLREYPVIRSAITDPSGRRMYVLTEIWSFDDRGRPESATVVLPGALEANEIGSDLLVNYLLDWSDSLRARGGGRIGYERRRYDSEDREVRRSTYDTDGGLTRYAVFSYDESGELRSATYYTSGNEVHVRSVFEHSAAGHSVAERFVRTSGGSTGISILHEYDEQHRLFRDTAFTDGAVRWRREYEYAREPSLAEASGSETPSVAVQAPKPAPKPAPAAAPAAAPRTTPTIAPPKPAPSKINPTTLVVTVVLVLAVGAALIYIATN